MKALARIDTPNGVGGAASEKRLVLLIEDERTQLLVLRTALEREGFRVEEAEDGLAGLQAYDRVRPDIVLLDVRMPVLDGFATCAAMRQRPGGKQVPILMLTILNDIESINRAYDAGATDFITKPVAWPVLGHRLRYMLRASEAFQSLARSESDLSRRVSDRTAALNAVNAELESANQELEAFTYSVSHDLRAPLRTIGGCAELMKIEMADLDSGKKELVDNLAGAVQRMSAMIDDLLRFSSTSRGDLMLKQVDLTALATQAVEGLRAGFPRTAIRVSALPAARCDSGLMQGVLENLIGNALKYSAKAASPVVEIGAETTGGEVVYFVRDNGAGFDVANARSLFGVFQRFHAESEYPGTGVGLAIVKRIIERHRGRVWAESAPDAGATFYFTLGAARRASDQEA